MTGLGKILVLVNLLFSVVTLGWAAQLYFHRIDWSNNKAVPGTPGRPAGKLVALEEQIRQLGGALKTAEGRFHGPFAKVQEREKQLAEDQKWYKKQLEDLRSGPDGKADTPVQTVVLKQGLPVLGPTPPGHPQMQAAEDRNKQPLLCEKNYLLALEVTHNAIAAAQNAPRQPASPPPS